MVLAGVDKRMSSASGEDRSHFAPAAALVLHSLKNVFRPSQCFLHVVANVFASDHVFEFGLPNKLCGLLPGATKNQRPTGGVQFPRHFLQRVQPGRVDRGHVAQPQNHHRRQFMDSLHDHRNFIRRPEQKRPVNAENGGVVRNVLVLQDVHTAIFDVVVGDLAIRS